MPIILDKGHFQACLSIVFILCTYMIFWPCNVKNGCTYLHRVQSWVTLPQWRKTHLDILLGIIWFVNSVTYLYFEYLCLFHACFLKECHILWHSDLQFKKWQDVPPNLHVDWRKISFMKQNWVITIHKLWLYHI